MMAARIGGRALGMEHAESNFPMPYKKYDYCLMPTRLAGLFTPAALR